MSNAWYAKWSSLSQNAAEHFQAGQYGQSAILAKQALQIAEQFLSPIQAAISLNNLGIPLQMQGQYENALSQFQQAFCIDNSVLGPDHINTATSLKNLAGLYRVLGECERSLSLYQRALRIYEVTLGLDHPRTASILNNLAGLNRAQGQYELALEQYQRAHTICKETLGLNHSNTATSFNNLAGMYESLGEYEQALMLYKSALKICDEVLDANHPNTASTLNNIAWLFKIQGKFELALPLFERALSIRETAFGEYHIDTAGSLNNLAALFETDGKYELALPLYERALKICHEVLGTKNRYTATTFDNLAGLFAAKGQPELAQNLYQQTLDIREEVLGQNHPDTAISLNNLALLLKSQGQYEDALPLYQRALGIFEKVLGPDHPDTAGSLNNLSGLFVSLGQYEDALPLYERAFDIYKRHPSILPSIFEVAKNILGCWKFLPNPNEHAKDISQILRERLTLINMNKVPVWRREVHNEFNAYHIKWMKRCLADNDHHTMAMILSLVSGWRMGQTILDAQVRDDPSQPAEVRRFFRLKHELKQLSDQIEAITTQAMDPVKAKVLDAKRDELRQQYDRKYNDLVDALTKAAKYPEYAAIGSIFGSYGEQLHFHLDEGEAIAFLVDFPEQNFRGILLQSRDEAQWFDLAGAVEGMNGLHYFNEKYAKGRGFRGHLSEIDIEAVEPVLPVFIKDIPAHLQASQFWVAFGQWIEERLWLPLKDALQEQKITHLNLITQGRTHSLPWEMNAPANLRLSRFPNGALFAMHKGLVPRPQSNYKEDASTNVPSLGLAASVDLDIPCAAMEIELIKNLWKGTIHSPYDYLSPPPGGVVSGHFSGHGVHRDDTPQQAYLEMGSTPWTVPEMMSSRIHPKRIFLSACVAGRTTETGEGDLYGFVTGLMQCGVQELSAATLNMDDMWMLALAINVQRRLHDDPQLTQGEALAQAKIALEKGELVTQEVKQAWFNALKKMRFDTNIAMILRSLNRGQEYIALRNYASYLDVETADGKSWWDNIVQENEFTARTVMIGKSVDMIPWRRVPPQPILGSLLHAVLHFG